VNVAFQEGWYLIVSPRVEGSITDTALSKEASHL
jgi:hypothetical protein